MNLNPLERNRPFILIGHLYFVAFLVMAAVFFRERTCLADCAFHLFNIIRTGTFAIYQNRYPIAIPQLLPVLGVKLQLSLNALMVLYSLSVPLVCYSFYLVVAHGLKDYKAAVAMVLAASIMLTQGFFFTWELNQAVCLLVLLFAFLQKRSSFRMPHWLVLTIGMFVALVYHPLVIIGLLYLIGYEFLRKAAWKDQRLRAALGITVGLMALKVVFLTSPYDKEKMSVASMLRLLPDLFSTEIFHNFSRWLVQDYYLLLIFGFIICLTCAMQRRWLLLGWYLAAVLGYMVLVMLAYPRGNDSIRYYLELHYQLLALFTAVPLAFDVLPNWQRFRLLPVAFALLLVSRFFTFYAHRDVFTGRLAWYDKLYNYTNQFPETRFFIDQQNVPDLVAQNQLTWASAHESLLYFLSTNRKPVKTVLIIDNPDQFGWVPQDGKRFISAFEVFPESELPQKYFAMEPSVYRQLNTNPAPEAVPVTNEVKIEPLVSEISGEAGGRVIKIPIRISSPALVPSGLDGGYQLKLGYRLYQGKTEIAAHTLVTPLEVDVKGEYQQFLLVAAPDEAGTYEVLPVLLPEEKNLWKAPVVKLTVE